MKNPTKFDLPELPDNMRWRFTRFTGSKELLLERKGWLFWRAHGRSLLDLYGTPEDAVAKAALECLNGKNWKRDVELYAAKHRRREAERSAQFPDGVVK